MTRDQLLDALAARRARKINLTWAQFAQAVGEVDATVRTELLHAANTGNARDLFTIVNGIVAQQKLKLARLEVDAAAVDDSLTVDELIALLG